MPKPGPLFYKLLVQALSSGFSNFVEEFRVEAREDKLFIDGVEIVTPSE